jgi:PAS domain S-box-containing protein
VTDPELQHAETVLTASRALAFLADASELLSGSLDYERTLREVVNLCIGELADWCGLYVLDEELDITAGHLDADGDAVLREIRRGRRREGASQAHRVAETGEPLLVRDSGDLVDAEDLDARQRAVIARLTPKSYMVLPLRAHGRWLGSLTLLSTRTGRHYGDLDLAFAQTLAGRCALAIDNAQMHREAERSLGLLDTVFATAPVGLAFVDRELRFVHVNATLAAFHGATVAEHRGRTLMDVLGDGYEEIVGLYRQVLESGEAVSDREVSAVPPRDPTGQARHWTVSYTPVRGAGDEILGVGAVVIDVTERRRLLEVEREARLRADVLARAGSLLDASLDYERTLRAVADSAVPQVADWCGVSILDESGELRAVAASHVDPRQRELGDELNRRFPPGRNSAWSRVARTGQTAFVREITDPMLEAGITDPERLALVRRLGVRSVIVAPLQAGGRTFGTLTLANAETGRLFDDGDVQLAEALARRAGIAIENARLYTERSRIAHALQVKLLPERLPAIPGALLAARYRAAGELNEVGGDFYDVFPRSEREWAMVVGDVSGKGAEAAALTALARYTLRVAAMDHDRPSAALRRLNAAMLDQEDPSEFLTAVAVYLAAQDGGQRMHVRVALGGHPPALVLRTDGRVEAVGTYGTMLGLRGDVALHDADAVLERGDLLLLYTDGVTEAGPRSAPFGDAGLRGMLPSVAGRRPQEVVDAVERAVLHAQQGQPRDDIALLALALG